MHGNVDIKHDCVRHPEVHFRKNIQDESQINTQQKTHTTNHFYDHIHTVTNILKLFIN